MHSSVNNLNATAQPRKRLPLHRQRSCLPWGAMRLPPCRPPGRYFPTSRRESPVRASLPGFPKPPPAACFQSAVAARKAGVNRKSPSGAGFSKPMGIETLPRMKWGLRQWAITMPVGRGPPD